MYQALLNELKQLNQSKRYSKFHERLHGLFGDQLDEENFLRRIAEKLDLRATRFMEATTNWKIITRKEEGEKVYLLSPIKSCTTLGLKTV